ncbi:MAG: hypothetical protein ABFR62_07585 [Bacteroidota bacterium]
MNKQKIELKTNGFMLKIWTLLLPLITLFSGVYAVTPPGAVRYVLDEPTINGHAGYMVAADVSGALDKVLLVVSGFDTKNETRPENELDDLGTTLQSKFDELSADGWDVMYFEYVDGGIVLEHNAENLAHFIRYLDSFGSDYHLAIVGGSMGGIVTRTMFVQENSNMGVETYVSLDSPHHGVVFSNWIENTGIDNILVTQFDNAPAGLQMYAGYPDFDAHYGWLRSVEASNGFMENIIDPMNTCAIALSNGEEQWAINWADISLHNKWYGVSSIIVAEGQTSTYMPYHSVVMMDDWSVDTKVRWNQNKYTYNNTSTRYFDTKIQNPADEHAGPDYAIIQAMDYVVSVYQ